MVLLSDIGAWHGLPPVYASFPADNAWAARMSARAIVSDMSSCWFLLFFPFYL